MSFASTAASPPGKEPPSRIPAVIVGRRLLIFALAAAVFVFTCGYRFAMLGGRFGGFENDQFVHLARAQQMTFGELPVRDFPEPGLPLTHALSALAQYAIGPTLWSEAVLTIGAVALASALLLVLAVRASGSLLLG